MPQLDVAESVLAKVAQWKKQAEGGVADGLAGLTSSMDPAAAAAAEQAMRYTAVGAGLGVGAGGLYALLNARRQKRESEQTARQAPTGVVLDLPVKAALATPLPWASAQDEIVKKYPHVSFPEKMSPGMLAAGIGAESAGRGLGYAIPGAAIGALTGDGALRGAAIGGGAGVGATLGGHAADQVAAHFGGSPMTRALGGLGGAVAGIGLGGYLGHKLVPSKKKPEEEMLDKEAAAGPDELAWATPARVLGGVGGAYLGFKGIQTVADQLNETQRQKRLEKAREEFSKALTGQFQAPLNLKAASVGERLGVALDRLYDLMQKDAGFGSAVAGAALNPGGTFNKTLGKYLGYWAVPTGLLGVYAGWKHGRKNTDAVAVEKARKLRLHQQFQESPPAMFVRPNPVPIAQGENEDEETPQGQIAA